VAIATPTSDIGALARNIQPESRACTVPSVRCRIAPTVLNTAPWKMSVPIATLGLNPNTKISSGVISEPPPIPVSPTSVPISRPASASSHSTG
jgi:hypothetical protein